MEKEFVSKEEAQRLKDLGFEDECMAYYEEKSGILIIYYSNLPPERQRGPRIDYKIKNNTLPQWAIAAPLHQQAERWLRSKGLFVAKAIC